MKSTPGVSTWLSFLYS